MGISGVVVAKLGGRSFESPEGRARLAVALAELRRSCSALVVVHGGGAQVTRAMEAAGLPAEFVRGIRVTTPAALAVAEPVFTMLGKELAHALTRAGAPAVAMTGRDAEVVRADVKDPALGRVGTVSGANVDALRALARAGLTPVVGPVAAAADGGVLNVNADEVASGVAGALAADHLVLLTDVEGVRDAAGATVHSLTPGEARRLIAGGVATGGMIPKIEGALRALAQGVKHVHVVSGERPDSLAELASGKTVGTTFAEG